MERMPRARTTLFGRSRAERVACIFVLSVGCFVGAVRAAAQDLGEIARQERQRKAQQSSESQQQTSPAPAHVYTEDDLARQRILTPEDRQRFDEARKAAPPQDMHEAKADDATQPSDQPSLGDVARAYRAQKAAQQSAKLPSLSLTLPLPAPILARPVTTVTPPPPTRMATARSSQMPASEATSVPAKANAAASLSDQPYSTDAARAYRAQKAAQQSATLPSLSLTLPRSAPIPARPVTTVTPRPAKAHPPHMPSPEAAPAPVRASAALPPAVTLPQEVQVHKGDTLWRFARLFLGAGSRWNQLMAANPGIQDPRRLQVNTWIVLPSSAEASLLQALPARSDLSRGPSLGAGSVSSNGLQVEPYLAPPIDKPRRKAPG